MDTTTLIITGIALWFGLSAFYFFILIKFAIKDAYNKGYEDAYKEINNPN